MVCGLEVGRSITESRCTIDLQRYYLWATRLISLSFYMLIRYTGSPVVYVSTTFHRHKWLWLICDDVRLSVHHGTQSRSPVPRWSSSPQVNLPQQYQIQLRWEQQRKQHVRFHLIPYLLDARQSHTLASTFLGFMLHIGWQWPASTILCTHNSAPSFDFMWCCYYSTIHTLKRKKSCVKWVVQLIVRRLHSKPRSS